MNLILSLCAVLLAASAERVSYDGYNVWEVNIRGAEDARVLQDMEREGLVDIIKLMKNSSTAEIWVGPQEKVSIFSSLRTFGMEARLSTNPNNHNIPEQIRQDFERLDARYAVDPYSFDLNDFNSYAAFMAQLDVWKAACPSTLDCQITTLGNSHLGKAIKMISVKKSGTSNPKVYLEHAIHPREWLSTSTIAKFIDHVIRDYGTDSEVQSILNKYELRMIPIVNVDGYEYTWSTDRMWRKNRRPTPGSRCTGTDLNRNFNAHWAKQGTSSNPCDYQLFHGPSAGSEPETKVVSNHMAAQTNVKAYFAVHCCYDVWMFPYGYNQNYNSFYPCAKTADHDDLMAVGKAAINAINGGWRTGTICDVIYAATGDTVNYMYDIAKIKYTFAVELHGDFRAPTSQIQPAYNDFWKGFMASMNKINQLG